ncbi:hypothetical protein EI77_03999 [Prosthecobacter fusiformis]|uniref:Uncharacterized protein n=1 Tax=Prosthecobacter fusiformis TaxID=48464 RepID=A0A4R7RKE4_9BACT|nr:hypothetical protein [Prosthecobacter fusiformis]TDU64549.1 hypothetical protein EI77_03999 [Prosthecobacter fusiformis]
MTLPALPDLTAPDDDLAVVRARLLAVRASLQKACQELDLQIKALEDIGPSNSPTQATLNLFETEPLPPVEEPAPVPAKNWQNQPTTSIILEATSPMALSPELEQATLEELNSALSKAFAQISGRHQWAG